jgi:hypothetical protein
VSPESSTGYEAAAHRLPLQQAPVPVASASTTTAATAPHGEDVVAGLAGGALVLLVVLALLVGVLLRRYRSECQQLRARNTQLSIENDHWQEDFAAQTGELAALRRALTGRRGYRGRSSAKAS